MQLLQSKRSRSEISLGESVSFMGEDRIFFPGSRAATTLCFLTATGANIHNIFRIYGVSRVPAALL